MDNRGTPGPVNTVTQESWLERLRAHRAAHRRNLDAGYLVAQSGTIIGTRSAARVTPP